MGYNISTLPDHIVRSENMEKFHFESVLGGQTLDFLSNEGALSEGVLGSTEPINFMKNTLVWQSGVVCKLSELGETALSEATVYIAPIAFKQAYCSLELATKWKSEKVKQQKKNIALDELQFGNEITNDLIQLNKADVEKAVWLGDSTKTGNMKFVEGFLKQLSTGTFALGTLTATDMIGKITEAYLKMPSAVTNAPDFRVFIGTNEYKKYRAELASKNLFHKEDEFAVFGTSAQFVVVDGLDATNKVVFARARNLQARADYEGTEAKVDVWYEKNDDEMKIRARFGLGVKAIFKQEIGVLDLGA